MEKQIDIEEAIAATLPAATQPEGVIQVSSEGAFREGARAMRESVTAYLETLERYVASAHIVAGVPLPAYAPPAPKPREGWQWWSGSNDEYYTNGPFGTRDEAIAALDGDGGHIIEAQRHGVRFDADSLINAQYFECDGKFDFDNCEPERRGGADVIAQADAELQAMLDAWLDRWRHTFVAPNMFAASRNGEVVAADPCIDCGTDCGDNCPADPAYNPEGQE